MENDMTKRWIFGVLLVCLGNPAVADTQPKRDTPRGELLYSTYCTACHSDQIHWRDKKIATDWLGLNAQVRHWQGIMGQVWSDDDIVEVARYLNVLHYHYPEHVQ
jgi:cytochrome c1